MNAPGRKFRTANLSILRTAKHSDGTIERILDCVNIGLTDRQIRAQEGKVQFHEFSIVQDVWRRVIGCVEPHQKNRVWQFMDRWTWTGQLRSAVSGDEQLLWTWVALSSELSGQFKTKQPAHAMPEDGKRSVQIWP